MRGHKGGKRIGNRRNSCTTCNNFAQNVLRLSRRRLIAKFADAYAAIRNQVELDLYPQVVEKWKADHPLPTFIETPPRPDGESHAFVHTTPLRKPDEADAEAASLEQSWGRDGSGGLSARTHSGGNTLDPASTFTVAGSSVKLTRLGNGDTFSVEMPDGINVRMTENGERRYDIEQLRQWKGESLEVALSKEQARQFWATMLSPEQMEAFGLNSTDPATPNPITPERAQELLNQANDVRSERGPS